MAGVRLEHWSTLNYDELQLRVDAEIQRTDLSFAEQQLLDAALERLKRRRGPHKRGSSMQNTRDDDPKANPEPEADKPKEDDKESKMKRTASKVRAGKKRNGGKTASKTRTAATRSRLDPDAKVTKLKPNPFREGSGSFERTELVLKASGQTVKTIMAKKGIKTTTLPTLVRKGIIKIS
jgi:cytoskeletal protein RodZ